VLEGVEAGQFVGEYVGEVLTGCEAKLRRQVCVRSCVVVETPMLMCAV
jgi:hypothetical protein